MVYCKSRTDISFLHCESCTDVSFPAWDNVNILHTLVCNKHTLSWHTAHWLSSSVDVIARDFLYGQTTLCCCIVIKGSTTHLTLNTSAGGGREREREREREIVRGRESKIRACHYLLIVPVHMHSVKKWMEINRINDITVHASVCFIPPYLYAHGVMT